MLNEVVTVYEAAQLLGETDRAGLRRVQRMCNDGRLTARQDVNGTWLILKKSVEELLK